MLCVPVQGFYWRDTEVPYKLQTALKEEICEWEWEKCDVPGYHAGAFSRRLTVQPASDWLKATYSLSEELPCLASFTFSSMNKT